MTNKVGMLPEYGESFHNVADDIVPYLPTRPRLQSFNQVCNWFGSNRLSTLNILCHFNLA